MSNKLNGNKHIQRLFHENQNIHVLAIIYIICNAYKIIFSLFLGNPALQTPQDIFSLLYSAAYAAGKDWFEIGQEYSAYYGYGFVILFSWLYRIFNDGLIVYRIILVVCHLIGIFSCVLCYRILLLFEITRNQWLTYFLAVACVSFQGNFTCGIVNEYPLNLCVWGILYVLLKLCSFAGQEKNKKKYTVYLGILLVYACTVHARAIVLYVLVGLCVVISKIIVKKTIVHIPTLICMLLFIIPYRLFTNHIQILLLGEINANSSVIAKVSNGSGKGFAWNQIDTFFLSIIMYLQELSLVSAGIFVICVSMIICILYHVLKREKIVCVSEQQRGILWCGLVYSLSGIAAFLIGMCISTRREIYAGMTNQISTHLRYLTLVRYFMPFVAPMAVFSIIGCIKLRPDKIKNITILATIIWIILQLLFVQSIYPKINYTGWANGIYLPFTWDIPMERQEVYLVGGVLIPFCVFTLCIWQIRKRRWFSLSILILLFTINGMMYKYVHELHNNKQFEMVNGGYSYFCGETEQHTINIVINTENDIDETTFYFLYQLLLPNMKIIPGEPLDKTEDIFILTNDPSTVITSEQYKCIQLDDNEWLLTNAYNFL